MTREEKLQLNADRKRAVKEAWEREFNLVKNGKGTVDWTVEQQQELIEKGHVAGFEGQHMKSVNEYPEYAGYVDNIQLLSHEDHLAAHNCSDLSDKHGYHSPTNGYYDTHTKTIQSFGDGPPRAPEVIDLSDAMTKEQCIDEYMLSNSHSNEKSVAKNIQDMSKHRIVERW